MMIYGNYSSILGKRIAERRKECGYKSQAALAEKMIPMCKDAENASFDQADEYIKKVDSKRKAIGNWELGNAEPSLHDLVQLCNLLNCDMGYLLGEYPERRRQTADICAETGLSEGTVCTLMYEKQMQFTEYHKMIDLLVEDTRIGNDDPHSSKRYRPILDLLHYLFDYENSGQKMLIYGNGTVKPHQGQGFTPSNAIVLDDTIIANAVLSEIQNALLNLKRQKERRNNNG